MKVYFLYGQESGFIYREGGVFVSAADDLVSLFFSTYKAVSSSADIYFTLLKRHADSLSLKSEIINAFKVSSLFPGPHGSFECFTHFQLKLRFSNLHVLPKVLSALGSSCITNSKDDHICMLGCASKVAVCLWDV